MANKVTIHDVVKKSGYSLGTVSRVISGSANVKESTRKEILKVIKELNYTPNVNGARLRKKHSGVIAVLVPIINHPFFAKFVENIEHIANESGYSLLLVLSQDNVSQESKILQMIKRKEIDGAIFITHYEHSDTELEGCPLVSVDRHLNHVVPFVTSDNYESTKQAIELFISHGAKEIGYIGTRPIVNSEVLLREKAYLDVIEEHHLTPHILNEQIKHGDEYALVDKFFENNPHLDAIFASGTSLAYITYQRLLEKNYKLPDDIELIGYDGNFIPYIHESDISFIEQPIKEMAEEAFKLLIKQINGQEVKQKNIFKTRFIKGKTTK